VTIVSMPPSDEHAWGDDEGAGAGIDEPVRPFTIFCSVPSPLSDDVEEIVAYMRLIGDRRDPGRTPR
jgi:hypothetical protein